MRVESNLSGHTCAVNVVRWTNNGKYCLSASEDRTVKLWNPFKEVEEVRQHSSFYSSSSSASIGSVHGTPRYYEEPVDSSTTNSMSSCKQPISNNPYHIKTYSGTHGYGIKDLAI